jgi:hypothetical protein
MDESGHWLEIQELLQKEPGILSNPLAKLAVRNFIATPAIVVGAFVYSRLGGFNSTLTFTEDWDMWKRIATIFDFWYEPIPIALWRQHPEQKTSRFARRAADLADIRKAIAVSSSYLPQPESRAWIPAARRFYALWGLRQAQERFRHRLWSSAFCYLLEAVKTSSHPAVLLRIPMVLLRGLVLQRRPR